MPVSPARTPPELCERGGPVADGEVIHGGEDLDAVWERALATDVLLERRRGRPATVHLRTADTQARVSGSYSTADRGRRPGCRLHALSNCTSVDGCIT